MYQCGLLLLFNALKSLHTLHIAMIHDIIDFRTFIPHTFAFFILYIGQTTKTKPDNGFRNGKPKTKTSISHNITFSSESLPLSLD